MGQLLLLLAVFWILALFGAQKLATWAVGLLLLLMLVEQPQVFAGTVNYIGNKVK